MALHARPPGANADHVEGSPSLQRNPNMQMTRCRALRNSDKAPKCATSMCESPWQLTTAKEDKKPERERLIPSATHRVTSRRMKGRWPVSHRKWSDVCNNKVRLS
ncbi:unnamed protein product [Arctogadus glacialis]